MPPVEYPDRDSRPKPGSTFSLTPGVRLEPLGDGSAVLYSRDLDESLSLNHTAALLCSFADGQHTVRDVLQEMRHTFSEDVIDENALIHFLLDLEMRKFLQWG
jgi:Coenzyme PQQ synthesis protein D (PqqD)